MVHWFGWFAGSGDAGSGGSLVQVVRWFAGSGGSLVQVVHLFRWFTCSGGLLV